MLGLIVKVVFIGSFFGIVIFVFRKIPILRTLPEVETGKRRGLISRLKKKLLDIKPFKNFSYELFLQKILSKIRILSLRVENKTFKWLQKLREKSKKKLENENYWEELKKLKNKNRPV